jgi:Flp pilus assembly protein TadG
MTEMKNRMKSRVWDMLSRFGTDRRGVAAIEFAVIFPFMLVLYFGVVTVGDLISANRKVTLASSALGDLVAQAPGTVTAADLNGLYAAITPIMDPLPVASVKVHILVYKKSGTAAVLRWQHNKNGTCTGTVPSNLVNMMADGNDLVLARVCTSYQPLVGTVVGAGPFNLTDQFVLRPREAPQLICTNC